MGWWQQTGALTGYAKCSKSGRKAQILVSLTYLWDPKNRNEGTSSTHRLMDAESKLMVVRGAGGRGLGEQGEGMKIRKSVVAKQPQGRKGQQREFSRWCGSSDAECHIGGSLRQ